MYPPLLTICLWHILSNYRLGISPPHLKCWEWQDLGAPHHRDSWSEQLLSKNLNYLDFLFWAPLGEGIFYLRSWIFFSPALIPLKNTFTYRCWVMTHISNLSFPLLFPYPTGGTTPWEEKKYISCIQTKPKERKETNVSTQISPTPITPVSNLAIPNLSLSLKNI